MNAYATDKTHPAPVYRWVIVFTAAAMLAIAMGQLVNGLSVFFIPLEQEFGWSRGSIALINSAGLVGLAIGSMVMGAIIEFEMEILSLLRVLRALIEGAPQRQQLRTQFGSHK